MSGVPGTLRGTAMAWYLNYYSCGKCGYGWDDEWSNCNSDECPKCGAQHCTPTRTEDVTYVVKAEGGAFVVYESPIDAEDEPAYRAVASCPTAAIAQEIVQQRADRYWGSRTQNKTGPNAVGTG